MQSQTYFKISTLSYITMMLLFLIFTATSGWVKTQYQDIDFSSLLIGTLFFTLIKCSLLLFFIPVYLKKDLKGLSWLCYAIMIYLIYTCMVALNMQFGELTDYQQTQQLVDRIFGGLLTAVGLVHFFSTTFYIRKEKIKLGLIIGKKAKEEA